MPTSVRLFVLALSTQLTTAAVAQAPPMVTDRPDFTESAGVVPLGLAQVEGGYTFARVDGVSAHAVGELLVRLPLLSVLEARVGLNSLLVEDHAEDRRARYEGVGLGLKLHFLDGGAGSKRWMPALAVLGGALVPLGGAVEQDVVVSGRIAAAWEIASRLGLGANLGLLSGAEGGTRFTQALTSVSAGFAASESTGLYVEYFGLHPESANGLTRPFLNGGVTQRLSPGLQLDARVGAALNGPSAVFAGLGFGVRW